MTQTIAEKIISQHAGQKVQAGDLAIVPVDGAMATDTSAPLAIKAFREMGGTQLWDASKMWRWSFPAPIAIFADAWAIPMHQYI